jgi:hypothetical protein
VCREELPLVNRLYTEEKGKDFEVLLVDFREDAAQVRQTVQDRGYVAPVLVDASGDVTGKQYGVWAPPTMFFVDRQGRLIGRAIGERKWDSPAGRAFIQALLEQKTR